MIDDVRQGSEAMPHQHPEEWVRDIILHPATQPPSSPPFRRSEHFPAIFPICSLGLSYAKSENNISIVMRNKPHCTSHKKIK